MRSENLPYKDGECDLEAFAAYPSEKKRPLVILCHAWRGRDDFICEKSRKIAELGYVGFALDMYGKGILGKSKEENAALKKPFIEDRAMLQRRVLKAYEVATALPNVDAGAVAVLGFGFGGVCALDLARTGVDLKGVITVYGHFDPPSHQLVKPIQGKVLVLHGINDPIAPLEELNRFEREMQAAGVDCQAQLYENTMHAFATPGANDPQAGILYNEDSANRAWDAIKDFLSKIF